MQFEPPLTLTLSPSDGERESLLAFYVTSPSGEHDDTSLSPLPFRRGEGQGEGFVRVTPK